MLEEHYAIEKQVLEKIKPSRKEYELVWKIYEKIRNTLSNTLEKHGIKADISLQGSIAKDTWLSGERDLDIFVLLPPSLSKEDIKTNILQILIEAAKNLGKYQLRYAEHPYVRVFLNSVEADLVPALKVNDPSTAHTAVDRTPFHTKYVIENLPEDGRDEVRLLKKFLKGIGVYGAEIKVRGFSGYLTELLIIKYRSFRELLKKASQWKPPVYINVGYSRDEFRKIINVLKRKYPDSIIYVPDPVDPFRNVAASVSMKSLAVFSIAARCYLNKPSIVFFLPREIDKRLSFEQLIKLSNLKETCIFFLIIPILNDLPPDTLWGELQRIADRLRKLLILYDFNVIDYSIWSDEQKIAIIGFELGDCVLDKYKVYKGPLFYAFERALRFIQVHYTRSIKGPWINDDGELIAFSERRIKSIEQIIVSRVKDYMVAPDFRNVKPIVTTLNTLSLLWREYRGFRTWLSRFIAKKSPWMESCIA
ncbi:MAG: CCA tRNA nucleotidyltransferase [Thermoprotei archaeon]|nr:MAG: CCA tRNA nucleotidyltransferase [Thermoprotei archaeon]